MDLKRFEAQGLIEKANFTGGQIKSNLNRAERDLHTAKANLKIDEEWAYTIAYHAMLRPGEHSCSPPDIAQEEKINIKRSLNFALKFWGKIFSISPPGLIGCG